LAVLRKTQGGVLRIAQGGSFTYFVLKSSSAGKDYTEGCVDPTGSVEVWRRYLILFAYRIHIAENPAYNVVTGG